MSIDIGVREWSEWEDVLPAPAWTGSTTNPVIGNGTIAGKLRRRGTEVDYRGIIQFGTTTTFGTGEWRIALPAGVVGATIPALSTPLLPNCYQEGRCTYVPAGAAGQTGLCWLAAGGTVLRLVTNELTPRSITGTVPTAFVAAATNFLSWQIRFECQPGS